MILYCGVTKEELVQHGICVDLLIDGGTSDEQLNIYHMQTWKYLLEKYKEVEFIFIDGGIYGGFESIESKTKIVNVIQKFCKGSIIIYGNHMLKRFSIKNIKEGNDLLERKCDIPFTCIPVEQYTMENFHDAYKKSTYLTNMQKVRVNSEYYNKF